MFLSHVKTFLLVFATFGPATSRGQVPDRQKTCSALESRAFTVGVWMTHDWTGGQMNGSKTRLAVVGKESQGGSPSYWYELTLDDPARPAARMIFQILVGGPGASSSGVQSVLMKTGNLPAMHMPPETVQMFNGMNVAQLARECQSMDVIASEDLTVPAGKFRALHLRNPRTALELWINAGPESGIVKLKWKDGSQAVLTAQGNGAKSSISGMP